MTTFEDRVRERAYLLWEVDHKLDHNDVLSHEEYWLSAERMQRDDDLRAKRSEAARKAAATRKLKRWPTK